MKPSTPFITFPCPRSQSSIRTLPHRPIQAVVVSLRTRCHLWLQHLHTMCFQELVNRVVWILEVNKLSRPGRTRLAASRCQPLCDAVVAQRTLVCHLLLRMNVPAPVGAGLHAICTSEAVRRVHQNHAVWCHECRAYRAYLRTRRIRAVVAHLRNEEVFACVFLRDRESFLAAVGRNDLRICHVLV